MAKILVVEDNRDLSAMITDWLTFEHYQVELAYTGTEAADKLIHYAYDAVVLDWDLPHKSGLEIMREFRASGKMTPILMLTGKGDIQEKEAGLDAGADDYLTKPFHMRELGARLRSLLRRASSAPSNVLTARDIKLNPSTFEVTKNGETIELLKREFALLEFFMRHPDEVFSAEALLQRVWHSESEATSDALRTCIKRLRQKIDADSEDSVIQTIPRVGYRLKTS